MGSAFRKEKPITQTVVLTAPVVYTSGEVEFPPRRPAKQTLSGAYIQDKNAPLYIRKLQTWAWENAEHHRTKRFPLTKSGTLVVRRGQPLKMTLTFNRPYNSLTDELKFYFETGEHPLPGNDTMVCLSSYTSQGSSDWKSDFLPVIGTKNQDCLQAHLWIFTPPDCIVSDWKFSLQSILRTETETAMVTYEHPEKIYILFNPWCKDDAVYLPAEPLLDEYVMNSSGLLFTGCRKRITYKPWIYGQFESGILEASLYIIKRGFNFRTTQSMGDPVLVTRVLSNIVNADENGGVLKGLWSTNDFQDGRSPTTWSGSVAILKQYLDNVISAKGGDPEPVKYGQCFVYAGLVTTICRALGIPCRCVTNYNSGRGTDGRLAIDFYYEMKEDGTIDEIESEENDDLVWTFHVWNDVWMRRTDVSRPYNEADWQALDATPQLTCVHSCGPAPLPAIKNCQTEVPYDVTSLFAEVNADVIHWLKVDMGNWTVFNMEPSRVGNSISSKTPDGRPPLLSYKYNLAEISRVRQDVTSDYKYKKGTEMERQLVKRPERKPRPMHRCRAKDVVFKLENKEFEYIGADFYVKAHVTNTSSESRDVHVVLSCEAVHYNGRRHSLFKKLEWKLTLGPTQEEQLKLPIYADDYIGRLAEHTCARQVGYFRCEDTDQIAACVDEFLFEKPHLELSVEETVHKNSNFELKLQFKNPLHKQLTACAVSVEGAGLESSVFIRNFKNVPALCEWTGVVNLLPVQGKSLAISATFHCQQMFDIVGFLSVRVEKAIELSTDKPKVIDHVTNVNDVAMSDSSSRVTFQA
ncbi:hemocyte protein-glutamine gamma-glutamyltransferase-like isoform X2 [Mya arenaria]|uniref:hemocyte protein-glutamine gamma-glutamyltransferase-like isoform X2 n=1 Tax=Mya arenaria TaxID=6604 RepID=UPI0022E81CE1|nr:hemocyte protein-glutamine gamma-glutamyltransferase-like isoform X2 [Mya arenaria]